MTTVRDGQQQQQQQRRPADPPRDYLDSDQDTANLSGNEGSPASTNSDDSNLS